LSQTDDSPTSTTTAAFRDRSCLEPAAFFNATASSSRAHTIWLEVLGFLSHELQKPVVRERKISIGMELDARFQGRKAYFAARVTGLHADGTVDLKYLPSFLQKKSGEGQQRQSSKKLGDAGFASVLDDGEIERHVRRDLLRLYPETPRTPREDVLQRLVNHLQYVLRITDERPVEVQHFRRQYLPKVAVNLPARRMPADATALLWMGCAPPPRLGLYDANRIDGLLYNSALYGGIGDEI